MSGATDGGGIGSAADARSEFDRGYHEGIAAAYRDVAAWSDARLDRLDPGKSKAMRLEIETARALLLHRLRYYLPQRLYPEFWRG